MKTLWWMVFKIISGNHLVYRPTDRPTDRQAKQYTPSSSKGGIKKSQQKRLNIMLYILHILNIFNVHLCSTYIIKLYFKAFIPEMKLSIHTDHVIYFVIINFGWKKQISVCTDMKSFISRFVSITSDHHAVWGCSVFCSEWEIL